MNNLVDNTRKKYFTEAFLHPEWKIENTPVCPRCNEPIRNREAGKWVHHCGFTYRNIEFTDDAVLASAFGEDTTVSVLYRPVQGGNQFHPGDDVTVTPVGEPTEQFYDWEQVPLAGRQAIVLSANMDGSYDIAVPVVEDRTRNGHIYQGLDMLFDTVPAEWLDGVSLQSTRAEKYEYLSNKQLQELAADSIKSVLLHEGLDADEKVVYAYACAITEEVSDLFDLDPGAQALISRGLFTADVENILPLISADVESILPFEQDNEERMIEHTRTRNDSYNKLKATLVEIVSEIRKFKK